MTRNSIGGVVDWTALSALADQHRPDDVDSLRGEARSLALSGLTPRDIAEVLHVGIAAVERLLSESSGGDNA